MAKKGFLWHRSNVSVLLALGEQFTSTFVKDDKGLKSLMHRTTLNGMFDYLLNLFIDTAKIAILTAGVVVVVLIIALVALYYIKQRGRARLV